MQPIELLDRGTFVFNAFSIPPAITALVILVAGIVVFRRERSTAAGLFLLLNVAVAWWLFSFAAMYSISEEEVALAVAQSAFLGIACIPTIIFQFIAVLTHQQRRLRGLIDIHWVLSVLFVTLILTTDTIVAGVLEYPWGFYPQYAITGIPFLVFFFSSILSSMWHSVRAAREAPEQEFGRLRGIAISLALGYLACTDFLASFGLPVYPMGYLAVLGFTFAFARTVSRFRLQPIAPGFAIEQILETIRGSVLVTGTDGIIRFVSDAACDLLGYTENEELVGKHIRTITLDQSAQSKSGEYDDLWQTKEGLIVDVMVTCATINDQSGNTTAVVYSAEDIRYKKREEALLVSEGRYRTLVEGMNEGVIVVDNADHILFVNPRLCQMLGYDESDLLGKDAVLLLVSDDDRREMASRVEARVKGVSEEYTIDMKRKDGTTLSFEISAAPLTDARGLVAGSIGICMDVSERRRAEVAIRESEARYRLMAEHATDMISRIAPNGKLLYTSPASRNLLGRDPEQLIGVRVTDFVHPEDVDSVRSFGTELFSGSSSREIRYRAVRTDGSTVWIEATCQPVRAAGQGVIKEVIAVSRDITERMLAEEKIHFQAYHDALTGLPNRKLFDDRLTIALAHARRRRTRGEPGAAAVLFLDLDHFKLVNDTFGHSAGDALIQQIASRLRTALRTEDTIARFGGDEFIILLPHMQDSEDAPRVAQKLLHVLEEPIVIDLQSIYTSASIGIAIHPEDGDTAEILLQSADAAMYRAKERARNTYQLASPAMNQRAKERLTVETSLHRALEQDEFELFYQPIVDTGSHVITSLEALIRWNTPEGLKLPESFLKVAEESFLITRIGEWVLRKACLQMREWEEAGIAPPRLSLNLSARQLEIPTLSSDIAAVLRETAVRPGTIELEITETAVLRDYDRTLAALRSLKAEGNVTVAIDDFGTGYSSLTYLRSFPIDRVKIDRSFIRDVARQATDAAIVGAVITMAHALEIDVVAEGVEDSEQVTLLAAMGCDHLQGFYFGHPASASEITELLRTQASVREHSAGKSLH